jgi:hypothetical protein
MTEYRIEVWSGSVWVDAAAPNYPSMTRATIAGELFYPLHITRAVPVRRAA